MMKRIVHISKSFEEAEEWDILQHTQLTPEERMDIADELRIRVYGEKTADIREVYKTK